MGTAKIPPPGHTYSPQPKPYLDMCVYVGVCTLTCECPDRVEGEVSWDLLVPQLEGKVPLMCLLGLNGSTGQTGYLLPVKLVPSPSPRS